MSAMGRFRSFAAHILERQQRPKACRAGSGGGTSFGWAATPSAGLDLFPPPATAFSPTEFLHRLRDAKSLKSLYIKNKSERRGDDFSRNRARRRKPVKF